MKVVALRLALAVGLAVPTAAWEQTIDISEEMAQNSGGIRDLGYFRSPQEYASSTRDGTRRRLDGAPSWQKVRVKVEYTDTSGVSGDKLTFLKDKLVPAMIEWTKNAFMQDPVVGPLLITQRCAPIWPVGDRPCYSVAPTLCGMMADGSTHVVPDSMLGSVKVCSGCSGDGTCTGCTESTAGAGAAETDFLLYVSAIQTDRCGTAGTGVAAWAGTCQRDLSASQRDCHAPHCEVINSITQSISREQRGTEGILVCLLGLKDEHLDSGCLLLLATA